MPSLVIPKFARLRLETLATRRSQIACELEEIYDEMGRLTTIISAYDEIHQRAHSPVELRQEPLDIYNPTNPTTENMTLTERVKQTVLMHPGTASDIAARISKSTRSVSSRLTVLANRGEIAHWPEYYMWGPIEWTPPTKGGTSNA